MTRERCPVCGATEIEELLELEDYPYAGNGVVAKEHAHDVPLNTLRIAFCHGCGMLFQAEPVPFDAMMQMHERQPPPLPMEQTRVELFETEHFFNQLRRYAPDGGRVLDIGCGMSGMLPRLAPLAYQLTGVEADARAAGLCRDERFEIINERFEEGLFEDESFDMVVCRSVLEHAEEPLPFLGAIDDVLKPGGLLAIEAPNSERVFRRNAFGGFSPHYQTYWSVSTLRFALTSLGLDILGGYDESYIGMFARKVDVDEEPIDPLPPADIEEAFEAVDAFLNRKDEIADEMPAVVREQFAGPLGVFGAGLPAVDMFFYCDIHDHVGLVATTDNSRHGGTLAGTDFEVRPDEDLFASDIEAVILLSERRQDELLDRLKPFLDRGGRVLRFSPRINIS